MTSLFNINPNTPFYFNIILSPMFISRQFTYSTDNAFWIFSNFSTSHLWYSSIRTCTYRFTRFKSPPIFIRISQYSTSNGNWSLTLLSLTNSKTISITYNSCSWLQSFYWTRQRTITFLANNSTRFFFIATTKFCKIIPYRSKNLSFSSNTC
jgi:hypothetical protein